MLLKLVKKLEAFFLQGLQVIHLRVIQVVIETAQKEAELTVKLEVGLRWEGEGVLGERERERERIYEPSRTSYA